MQKLYFYSILFSLIFFIQRINAQNVDGDGMYILITADTIIECQDTVKVKVETCHISQLSIGLNTVNVVVISPFEIEIDLSYCRTGVFTSCHDTTFVFPSLPDGDYKFIIKSTVEDCMGGGFFAQDEDTIFTKVNRPTFFNPFVENEVLCKDGSFNYFLELDGLPGFKEYYWSDGSDGRFLLVKRKGVYSVTVRDVFGCVQSDTVEVLSDCNPNVYIPNSFTPNNDGVNDEFRIYGSEIDFDRMMIFNRWGELIFETTALDMGWGGEEWPVGVYFYRVYYRDSQGLNEKVLGSLSLIR